MDKWIAIDADETIFDRAPIPFVGRVKPGAREVISELRRRGFKILIWSARNNRCFNNPVLSEVMMKLLEVALRINGIEYDAIDYGMCGKPVVDLYIDDKAILFDGDWYSVLKRIEKRFGSTFRKNARRREYKILGLKIIVTDEDLAFEDEGEIYYLSDETGWWEEDGTIYIWGPELSRLKKVGIGVHEFVESVLVRRLKMPRRWAHYVANVLEWIVTFGKADIYW